MASVPPHPDHAHLAEPTTDKLAAELPVSGDTAAELPVSGDTAAEFPASDDYEVFENRDEGRFELHHGGQILSIASFSERAGGVVVIPHVETDPQHRGQGNADRLMEGLLTMLHDSNRKVVPACPFAAQYIKENPGHQALLTRDF